MRFLTTEVSRKCINIDKIEAIMINKINQDYSDEARYILVVNREGFYVGSFDDVKIRYINLVNVLSNGDTPSGDFISNNVMVVMKDDGTFECVESGLWVPDLKEDYFA